MRSSEQESLREWREKNKMQQIEDLREQIDKVDTRIILVLKERVELSKTIGLLKRKHKIPIKDFMREATIYDWLDEQSRKMSLNPDKVKGIYDKIIDLCINAQLMEER